MFVSKPIAGAFYALKKGTPFTFPSLLLSGHFTFPIKLNLKIDGTACCVSKPGKHEKN
jgi:hypothetical protein